MRALSGRNRTASFRCMGDTVVDPARQLGEMARESGAGIVTMHVEPSAQCLLRINRVFVTMLIYGGSLARSV
jgi:hypothetical protein